MLKMFPLILLFTVCGIPVANRNFLAGNIANNKVCGTEIQFILFPVIISADITDWRKKWKRKGSLCYFSFASSVCVHRLKSYHLGLSSRKFWQFLYSPTLSPKTLAIDVVLNENQKWFLTKNLYEFMNWWIPMSLSSWLIKVYFLHKM